MRDPITVAASIVLLTASAAAVAQQEERAEFGADAQEGLPPEEPEEEEPGYLGALTMGFRAGYALPLGKVTRDAGGARLADLYAGQVPVWFDIAYEPIPNLVLGGYAIWGPAFPVEADPADPAPDACDPNASCFGHVFRGGGQLHWLFAPSGKLNPWIGLGAAYEFAFLRQSQDGLVRKAIFRGPELINFQLGLDVKPREQLGIGPFASFSIGRYTHCKFTENGDPAARCDIESRAQHEWFMLGVRTYFSFIEVKKRGVEL